MIGILLILALAVRIFFFQGTNEEPVVNVYVDKIKTHSYLLNDSVKTEIQGVNGLSLSLEVEEGRVRVVDSKCPGKICEKTSYIDKTNESILCLPAKIVILIENAEENEYDSISR